MMSRKGQAAMEFLMTYGWAILIAIIAIAALIAFGVLNPGRGQGNTCGTSNAIIPNLGCEEMKAVGSPAALTLILRNGLGAPVNVLNLSVIGCAGTGTDDIPDALSTTYSFTDCKCTNGRVRQTLSLNYTLGEETLSHVVTAPLNIRCE